MRIVFFGSGAFGLPTLERLAQEHTLTGIVTQPDRPAGRKRVHTPTPIASWAAECAPEVPVFKPERASAKPELSRIRALDADAWVVIAFGQKLSNELLADRFAINLHASLLPRWRGASPIASAMLAGDRVTGNSVITLAERMDAGEVLGTSRLDIDPAWTCGELHDKLSALGPDDISGVLERYEAGTLERVVQDESRVTIAGKLSKADGWIDCRADATRCRDRIHALNPWPAVSATLAGEPIKLLRARAHDAGGLSGASADDANREASEPGALLDVAHGLIACGKGSALELIEVQPPGKKPMRWDAFSAGRSLKTGDVLRSELPG